MTKEEASNQINDMKIELAEHLLKKDIEALDMAISALSEELSEDGTLTVHVSDGSKVTRVFVMGDNIFGGLYYPDSAEIKEDWIPVAERLPEDYDRVLITVNGCRGLIVREAQYHKAKNEFEVLHNHDRWEVGEKGLLAWQPLPEPYKGESEGTE